ncbi:MAG: DUF805 domain-containing protein [Pseudomonadota bacterium]
MFKDYLFEISDGRLKTMPFLVRWLILLAVFIGLAIGIGAAIGMTERLIGGDIDAVRQELSSNLGTAIAILVLLTFFVFAFAKLNIIAKRARDVGLPGWLTALVIAALFGAAPQVTGHAATGGLGMLLVLILAVLPTDMMRRKS